MPRNLFPVSLSLLSNFQSFRPLNTFSQSHRFLLSLPQPLKTPPPFSLIQSFWIRTRNSYNFRIYFLRIGVSSSRKVITQSKTSLPSFRL
jgi:hypothetical protein